MNRDLGVTPLHITKSTEMPKNFITRESQLVNTQRDRTRDPPSRGDERARNCRRPPSLLSCVVTKPHNCTFQLQPHLRKSHDSEKENEQRATPSFQLPLPPHNHLRSGGQVNGCQASGCPFLQDRSLPPDHSRHVQQDPHKDSYLGWSRHRAQERGSGALLSVLQTLLLVLLDVVHLTRPIACELRTQHGRCQTGEGREMAHLCTCAHAVKSGLACSPGRHRLPQAGASIFWGRQRADTQMSG